eukprot:743634-Pelagomonas_calceolata.AAC.4
MQSRSLFAVGHGRRLARHPPTIPRSQQALWMAHCLFLGPLGAHWGHQGKVVGEKGVMGV